MLDKLVGAAMAVACLWASVRWRPGVKANWKGFVDLAPFSGGISTQLALVAVSTRFDQAVIGTGIGVAALGAYVVAQRVISLLMELLTAPMQSVAMPAFSKIQDDPVRLARAYERSTIMVCAFALPVFLGMILVGPNVIHMVFGAKWEASIVPMQILCVAGILRAAQTFVHPTFIALGRVGLYMLVFGFDAALSAVGCWIAATHGMAAVAWAVVFAAGATGVANLFVVSRLVCISFASLTAGIWPILAACGIMVLTVLGIDRSLSGRVNELTMVIAQAVAGAVVYSTAVSVLARDLWGELWSISKTMIGKKGMVQNT